MSNTFSHFIGIDVAKDKVDVFSTQKSTHFTVNNSRKDIRQALYHFDRENTLVVFIRRDQQIRKRETVSSFV